MSLKEPESSDRIVEADLKSREYTGHSNAHTDADGMRRILQPSPPAWDSEAWDWPVVPDLLEHTHYPDPDRSGGGTDLLATGAPGSGKSTLALTLSMRLLEINRETVVWRGSTSRSEWSPFAPWARVCVPERTDVEATLVPRDPRKEEIDVDLEEIAREVVTYQNPIHLNKQVLEPGVFNVVYPDPRMFDCEAIFQDSDRGGEYVDDDEELFSESDPLKHWWFAWILARIDEGPFGWTTLIADEIGDIAPESARSDSSHTFEKIELLRDTWVDARKKGLSIFAFGHSERDIHNLIRHKIRWRAAMSGGGNPTSGSDLIGFDVVPMNSGTLASRMDLGEALIYSESSFDKISWSDAPDPLGSYSLEVSLEPRRGK